MTRIRSRRNHSKGGEASRLDITTRCSVARESSPSILEGMLHKKKSDQSLASNKKLKIQWEHAAWTVWLWSVWPNESQNSILVSGWHWASYIVLALYYLVATIGRIGNCNWRWEANLVLGTSGFAKMYVFFRKRSEGVWGSFPIQTISVQVFCIINGIFWSQIVEKFSKKRGGVISNSRNFIANLCKLALSYQLLRRKKTQWRSLKIGAGGEATV